MVFADFRAKGFGQSAADRAKMPLAFCSHPADLLGILAIEQGLKVQGLGTPAFDTRTRT